MFKFLTLLLLFSCSSYRAKKNQNYTDQQVSSYFSSWKNTNSETADRKFRRQYENYLESVEKIFLKEGMAKNIGFYFDSLKVIDQNLVKGNVSYNELYSKTDPETKKTRIITELYDSLIEERSDKLLDYYGFNFYSELMRNKNKFVKKEKNSESFPL